MTPAPITIVLIICISSGSKWIMTCDRGTLRPLLLRAKVGGESRSQSRDARNDAYRFEASGSAIQIATNKVSSMVAPAGVRNSEGCYVMADTIIMRGAYAIPDPRLGASGVIPAGAVVIVDGTVKETGPCAAVVPKYPGATIIGDGTQLLLPGLVDAHSHGRGLSPIQKGARNDFLENALFDWAYMPILPPELTAAICALRHLRSGCTLLHHNGFDDDGAEGARRAHIAIKTYLSTGIRLAFSPGVRDESKLAMGGEEFI
ncbi:MAG: hypothetical protein WA709_36450, partial [Stellaceae bacterium]